MFGAIALKALEVYAISTPWLHQDTTTIVLYGAYEDEPKTPGAPRPAYGHSKDSRDDLTQGLLSLGVSGDGGIPLRVGIRDGNRSDSVETPLAIEECLALGLEGVLLGLLPPVDQRSYDAELNPGMPSPVGREARAFTFASFWYSRSFAAAAVEYPYENPHGS